MIILLRTSTVSHTAMKNFKQGLLFTWSPYARHKQVSLHVDTCDDFLLLGELIEIIHCHY